MLIGLLSDAHGNPLGLSTCLAALRREGVGPLYYLGDAMGYMSGEADVLRLLDEAGALCVRGNHEAMMLGELDLDPVRDEAYGLAGVRERISPRDRDTVAGWPERREVTVGDRRVLIVHGSPTQPLTGYVYPDTDIDRFGDLGYDAVFMGNTHRPFVARRGDVLIANVGSCGLPRDQGDLMSCAVYDSEAHACRILRVRLDTDEILGQFPNGVTHPIVSDCLHRQVEQPFGSVVPRA